jgi:penicillin-binding protein 2
MIVNIPLHSYQRKLKILGILIIVIFIFFIGSFWYIQIIQEAKYKELSQHNYLRIVPLKAPRGDIYDRNGALLASNRPSFNIALFRNKAYLTPHRLKILAEHLDLKANYLQELLERYRQVPLYLPVVIKEDASFEEVAYLEARKLRIPEILIEVEPKRIYLYGEHAAHLLGYIGEVSREQLDNDIFEEVQMGDIVGKSGLENWYNKVIMGKNGYIEQKVDAKGVLAGSLMTRKPISGSDAYLTIDINLQSYVEAIMKDMIGAAVGIDPQTGEVLFMVSTPTFNPNDFARRFTQENWLQIVNNPAHPLQNRCISGFYPAGSVFKLLIAVAGLEEGVITPETRFTCNGSIYIYGHQFFCNSRGGHGSVDLYRAISRSCNIYFYQVGKGLGIEKIAQYARKFGFGTTTGIDLPFEFGGLIPDPQWKYRLKGKPWYPGETISVSIGQGAVGITPLQLALFTAAIANEGTLVQPRVLKEVRNKNGKLIYKQPLKPKKKVTIKYTNAQAIKKGMWGVINDHGTGWRAFVEDFNAAGKTGTAQIVSQKQFIKSESLPYELRDHSWFTCFAPFDEPEIVVAVLIEHGGQGGTAAAPVAGKILKGYKALQSGRTLQSLIDSLEKSRIKDITIKAQEVNTTRGN